MYPQVPQAKGSLKYVSTDGNKAGARSVEEPTFVSMGDDAINARSVEEAAFVSTGGNAVGARSVEEVAFVSMGGDASVNTPTRVQIHNKSIVE
jgi:hypothetical protein